MKSRNAKMSARKGNRWFKGGCQFSLIGVSVLALVLFGMRHRSKPLPEGCTLLWQAPDGMHSSPYYWWLSKTIALIHLDGPNANHPAAEGYFLLYNRETRQETLLPQLTDAFNKTGAYFFEATLSSDNRSLVWKNKKWPLPPVAVNPPVAEYQILFRDEILTGGGKSQVKIDVNSVGATAKTIHTFTVKLPDHYEIGEVALSRQGDKIAWLFGCGPTWFTFPNLGLPSQDAMVQLWVSNIDGANMHQVGYFRFDAAEFGDHGTCFPSAVYLVQWLPDGKSLSFLFGSTMLNVMHTD